MLLILLLNVQIYKLNGQLYYQCTLLKQDVYDRPGFVLTEKVHVPMGLFLLLFYREYTGTSHILYDVNI